MTNQRDAAEAVEAAAKAHCDFFCGEGWWDTGLLADTRPKALEAMRAAIAAYDASLLAANKQAAPAAHKMVAGGFGHGLSHCEYCKATDREIAFDLGQICPNAPASANQQKMLIAELADALEDARNNGFGEAFFRSHVNELLSRARTTP